MHYRSALVAVLAVLALAHAVAASAQMDALDQLQSKVQKKLELAEAKGALPRHQILQLHLDLNAVAKKRAAAKSDTERHAIVMQLQSMDKKLSARPITRPEIAADFWRWF
jgi:hypothetical protein